MIARGHLAPSAAVISHGQKEESVFVGADIGGTFTDVAAYDETTGEVLLSKVLSTPQALEVGVRRGSRGPWQTSRTSNT